MEDPTKTPAASQLALQQAASGAAQPSPDAAADKAAADKAAADKAAADKAAADKAAADKAAADKAKAAKSPRARRGPPADGQDEDRVKAILTTSKLMGRGGVRLRRGQAVSVPTRRLAALVDAGKIRRASEADIENAEGRFGLGLLG